MGARYISSITDQFLFKYVITIFVLYVYMIRKETIVYRSIHLFYWYICMCNSRMCLRFCLWLFSAGKGTHMNTLKHRCMYVYTDKTSSSRYTCMFICREFVLLFDVNVFFIWSCMMMCVNKWAWMVMPIYEVSVMYRKNLVFRMLDFSIYLILSATLWPWGWLSL
jgi:hypothetical protein